MPINVLSAAKFAGEFLDWSKSHLYIQKLLYIAHMYYLGQNGGKPLVEGNFEASDYGPVHPALYHKAKIFGSDPVKNIFRSSPKIEDGTEKEMLKVVLEVLRDSSGAKLVAMTHREEGAWAKHYHPGTRGITIPNEDIIEEYHYFYESAVQQ